VIVFRLITPCPIIMKIASSDRPNGYSGIAGETVSESQRGVLNSEDIPYDTS